MTSTMANVSGVGTSGPVVQARQAQHILAQHSMALRWKVPAE